MDKVDVENPTCPNLDTVNVSDLVVGNCCISFLSTMFILVKRK